MEPVKQASGSSSARISTTIDLESPEVIDGIRVALIRWIERQPPKKRTQIRRIIEKDIIPEVEKRAKCVRSPRGVVRCNHQIILLNMLRQKLGLTFRFATEQDRVKVEATTNRN